MSKVYRFFFHYRKSTNGMTLHYRGKCYPCKNVECLVPVVTKFNDKQQPHLVMQGFATSISVVKDDNGEFLAIIT